MYGTIIINDTIQNSIELLKSSKDNLDISGNIFVMVRNEVDAIGDVSNDFLDIIHSADKMEYVYVNTIVAPTENIDYSTLPDNVLFIVWLAKDKNHFFNKDVIREKHIWKDVEWGKRAKNYNPKGKDPARIFGIVIQFQCNKKRLALPLFKIINSDCCHDLEIFYFYHSSFHNSPVNTCIPPSAYKICPVTSRFSCRNLIIEQTSSVLPDFFIGAFFLRISNFS